MNTSVLSPRDLPAALRALEGAGDDTLLLAGGTDLMVEFESGRTAAHDIIDLWAVDELRGIEEVQGGLRLGSLTTCSELLADERVQRIAPALVAAAQEVGAEQIKNRATLGGNLGTASPAADLTPVLFALGADVRLLSVSGAREMPATEFLTGYRSTARRVDELIESVWIPPRPVGERSAFRKVGTRRAQSISKVVLAGAGVLQDGVVQAIDVAAGSVAAQTLMLPSLRSLIGTSPDAEALRAASAHAAQHDVTPIDDVRSTGDYRKQVLFRVLERMLRELLSEGSV